MIFGCFYNFVQTGDVSLPKAPPPKGSPSPQRPLQGRAAAVLRPRPSIGPAACRRAEPTARAEQAGWFQGGLGKRLRVLVVGIGSWKPSWDSTSFLRIQPQAGDPP